MDPAASERRPHREVPEIAVADGQIEAEREFADLAATRRDPAVACRLTIERDEVGTVPRAAALSPLQAVPPAKRGRDHRAVTPPSCWPEALFRADRLRTTMLPVPLQFSLGIWSSQRAAAG